MNIKRVCLVGNQNCGKTLLFNVLCNMSEKVGNWAGVTVDIKKANIINTNIELIDLPGVYSLSPYTKEEEITLDFLLNNKIDLIVNVFDVTNFERSMYLTLQLKELNIPMLLCFNMEDLAKKQGIFIDYKMINEKLKIDSISISALKRTNLKKLVQKICDFKIISNSNLNIYNKDIISFTNNISNISFFNKIKIFERDKRFYKDCFLEYEKDILEIEEKYNMDSEELLAKERYDFIEKNKDLFIQKKEVISLSEKIDKIVLNKYFSYLIFFLVMFLVYLISIGLVGGICSSLIDLFFNGGDSISFSIPFVSCFDLKLDNHFYGIGERLYNTIIYYNGSFFVSHLVRDGIVRGISSVLVYLPQILCLFFFLSILENIGFMARVTFIFDKLFKKIGLSGKSLIPFILGTGCSVPAILSSRTIENKRERNMTIILTPFIPCSAKLPVINAFLSGIFSLIIGSQYTWLVSLFMYFLSILVIICCGYVFNLFNKSSCGTYLLELPHYRIPSFKYIFKDVLNKGIGFIKKAMSIIFLCSLFIWLLLNINFRFEYIIDKKYSILAYIGNFISYFFYFMLGFNLSWATSISAIQGLIAKEGIISCMEIISKTDSSNIFSSSYFSFFNVFSALGFLIFIMFSAPCIGSILAMKKEMGTKYMLKAILFQTLFAYTFGSLVGSLGVFIK